MAGGVLSQGLRVKSFGASNLRHACFESRKMPRRSIPYPNFRNGVSLGRRDWVLEKTQIFLCTARSGFSTRKTGVGFVWWGRYFRQKLWRKFKSALFLPKAFEAVEFKNQSVMEKIRVILADDHTVVRQGLRALLAAEEDIDIVGEAENGRQAIQLARKLLPDVAVIDIAMPVLNGLEATRQITRSVPGTKVLILSSYSDDEYVQQLTEAGAAGYLVKQTAANDLLKAIREAHKGNAFFSPAIAKRLRDHCRQAFVQGQPVRRRPDYLTTREAEVLQLIAEGRANKQIAAELSISIKTVEKHRQQVMNKLNIHDVAGLTRHAIAKGIIESNAGLRAV